jgi:hypothetical protein
LCTNFACRLVEDRELLNSTNRNYGIGKVEPDGDIVKDCGGSPGAGHISGAILGFSDGKKRIFGAGNENRTRDLLITSQPLYQLSYPGFGINRGMRTLRIVGQPARPLFSIRADD